jgi:hypothetical protein
MTKGIIGFRHSGFVIRPSLVIGGSFVIGHSPQRVIPLARGLVAS